MHPIDRSYGLAAALATSSPLLFSVVISHDLPFFSDKMRARNPHVALEIEQARRCAYEVHPSKQGAVAAYRQGSL